jgi:hypothetical protein
MPHFKDSENKVHWLDEGDDPALWLPSCTPITNDQAHALLAEQNKPTNQQLLDACKAEAKQRLADTDWSQITDVAQVLLNKSDFDNFRALVRNIYLDPVSQPTWPEEPKAVWTK